MQAKDLFIVGPADRKGVPQLCGIMDGIKKLGQE